MPNIKSAKDRVKLSAKQNLRNRMGRSALKSSLKGFETAVGGQDAALTQDAFKAASIKLDKAASKGLIHKNTAARKKSRMAARITSAAN